MSKVKYRNVTKDSRTNIGYEKVTLPNGDIWYLLNGEFHREGGPAVIYPNDSGFWCINGLYHREDGPAVEKSNGKKQYWLNGNLVVPSNYHLFSPLELAKLGLI